MTEKMKKNVFVLKNIKNQFLANLLSSATRAFFQKNEKNAEGDLSDEYSVKISSQSKYSRVPKPESV